MVQAGTTSQPSHYLGVPRERWQPRKKLIGPQDLEPEQGLERPLAPKDVLLVARDENLTGVEVGIDKMKSVQLSKPHCLQFRAQGNRPRAGEGHCSDSSEAHDGNTGRANGKEPLQQREEALSTGRLRFRNIMKLLGHFREHGDLDMPRVDVGQKLPSPRVIEDPVEDARVEEDARSLPKMGYGLRFQNGRTCMSAACAGGSPSR